MYWFNDSLIRMEAELIPIRVIDMYLEEKSFDYLWERIRLFVSPDMQETCINMDINIRRKITEDVLREIRLIKVQIRCVKHKKQKSSEVIHEALVCARCTRQ